MNTLDKQDMYTKIDRDNFLKNVQEFPWQCERAWQDSKRVIIPSYYTTIDNIVILGVGGSGIGGEFVKALSKFQLKVPLEIVKDYELPSYVDKSSLVIGISYSGNTEEALVSFNQAISRKAKCIAITTGGKLSEIALSSKIPLYQFNYPTQPRQAFGFLFISILSLMNKIALIDVEEEEFKESVLLLKALNAKIKPEIPTSKNQSKKLAEELFGKIVIVLAANYLKPIAFRFKAQLNENSKQMSFREELPEACHNFVVGLQFPNSLTSNVFVLSLLSKFDHQRVRVRQKVITELLRKNRIPYDEISLEPSPTAISEMLSLVYLLDYTSYYLAILNKVDPKPVLNIDYLKKRLEEAPWQR